MLSVLRRIPIDARHESSLELLYYCHDENYSHTHINSYTHTLIHTCAHAHIHTYTHAHMHTCTHTHIHAYTLIHTHTHSLASSDSRFSDDWSPIARKNGRVRNSNLTHKR